MKKGTALWKFMLPLILGALIMSVAFTAISYVTFRDVEIRDYEDYARGLTSLIAGEIIRANDVDGYLQMGRAFPNYRKTEQRLYKLRDAYPDVVYLYAYQMREDGCHVVFDLDTEQFKGTEPGGVEFYFPAFRPYLDDLLAGREVPSILSKEKYGYVLTVLTPLYDARGVCKCYIGADCSMERLHDYVWEIIRQIALIFVGVVAAVLLAGLALTKFGVVRQVRRLEDRAYRDTLTGLLNRTAYYEYSAELNRRIEAGTADFSILMIDINYLKRVNDTYGHERGNEYLKGAADLIRRFFGEKGVYRIGGDEFTAVLEGEAQEGAEDRIRAFKAETERLQADGSLQPWEKISAAAGIAAYERGACLEAEEVLREADEAMYADKLAMKAVRTD